MKHLLLFGIAFAVFHISHEKPDLCLMKREEGEGTTFTFALYFNAEQDICEPFLYKGQGGNANRFQTERDCIANCSDKAEEIYPKDVSKACHFPKASGKGASQIVRFYYDSVHDKCKSFIWTGYLGNGNRFLDQLSCNATCHGIHDDGDALEEEEPDTPFGIICGVLIGVIAAIVLIMVVALTVKSKNSPKKAPKKSKEPPTDVPLQEPAIEMA